MHRRIASSEGIRQAALESSRANQFDGPYRESKRYNSLKMGTALSEFRGTSGSNRNPGLAIPAGAELVPFAVGPTACVRTFALRERIRERRKHPRSCRDRPSSASFS